MELSNDLIREFVRINNDDKKTKNETTVYGEVVQIPEGSDTSTYVRFDGAAEDSTPTPVLSTVKTNEGDRVVITLKNHVATITGNLTSPSTTVVYVDGIKTDVDEAVKKIEAYEAAIENLDAMKASIKKLETESATIALLESDYITADDIEATYIKATKVESEYAKITTLESDYAKINLSNVKKADIGTLLANVGLISDATIVDGHVTGYLDSVEINANNITAGTLAVDRLVISGTDKSIIFAINNTGVLTSTESNTINGDVITKRTISADHIIAGTITSNELHSGSVTTDKIVANAVTAEKISVSSLESIVAKIGSFDINNALYSNGHSAYNSAVNGVYVGSDYISLGNGGKTWLKNDGSVSIGNGAINYNATNGVLDINASSIKMASQTLALKTDVDNIEIGGRNYFRPTRTVDLGCTGALDSATLTNTGACVGFYVPTMAGDVWSISRSSIDVTNRFDYGFTVDEPTFGVRIYDWNSSYRDKTKIEGIIIPEGYNYLFVYLSNQNDDASSVKIERGNKATDWTPAPEDVESDILNASKTATNYMNFSSGGLVIGDLTASSLGKNVLIDSSSVKIRTGTTENAKFGADIIELAKYNESAVISMLNDTFKIYYSADTSEKGLGIYGKTSTGEDRLAFQPVNENDNLTIGWGGYDAKKNSTNIYGHNMKLIAGNDMSIENDRWRINIDGNLFGKASNNSFVELIGLSSDNNTTIGHGGYTSALGKTNIYGNKIQHIVNTTSGSASYKPYYEAGDSFETEWYGAGFVSSSSKIVYFSIPLAKPVIGNTTPKVTVANGTTSGGLQIRQNSQYVFGSSSSAKTTNVSYKANVVGDGNFVQIEATMTDTTNAINNEVCGINASIKITFS